MTDIKLPTISLDQYCCTIRKSLLFDNESFVVPAGAICHQAAKGQPLDGQMPNYRMTTCTRAQCKSKN